MKKIIAACILLISVAFNNYAQVTKVLTMPNARCALSYADSQNLYYLEHLGGDVKKLDPADVSTVLFHEFGVDNMIANKGKVLYLKGDSTVTLFDGITKLNVPDSILPYSQFAWTNFDNVKSRFHLGATTYFHSFKHIYKTDYSSVASIQKVYTAPNNYVFFQGIYKMEQLANSIYLLEYRDSAGTIPFYLKKIDMISGNVSILDSSFTTLSLLKYKSELIFNKMDFIGGVPSAGVKRISANGTITSINIGTELVAGIIGVTPNGIIAKNFGDELLLLNQTANPVKLNHTTASTRYPDVTGGGLSGNSLVYFVAGDSTFGNTNYASSIWVTDGTLVGTKKVINKNNFSGQADFSKNAQLSATCGDDIYFSAEVGSDNKLYYINGTNLTYTVGSLQENLFEFYNIDNRVYFLLDSVATRTAIYKSTNVCGANVPTGIANSAFNNLNYNIYPNPNNGNFSIQITDNLEDAQVIIYNMLGELVFGRKIANEFTNLNANLQQGLYFVSIENNKQTRIQKIIVE